MALRIRQRSKRLARTTVHFASRQFPLRPHRVLYESFHGAGVLCNPEAIFQRLLSDPDYNHLHHVWVVADESIWARVPPEIRNHPRVSHTIHDSTSYRHELAVCTYLINNVTFKQDFAKRSGQVYVNTWHGTPLKLMGYDRAGNFDHTLNVVRNFLSADYLVSSNSRTLDMYLTGHRLAGMTNAIITDVGTPRVDRQHGASVTTDWAVRRLIEQGISLHGKRVVLYAPTWRGSRVHSPRVDREALVGALHALTSRLGDDVVILLKVHQAVFDEMSKEPDLEAVLVPNDVPTNEILGLTDVLITDYSSICIDFLETGRPVVFYQPDREGYAHENGLYDEAASLPGQVVTSTDGLSAAVDQELSSTDRHPNYAHWRSWSCPHERGNSAARVIDIVFGGSRDGTRSVASQSGKPKMLLALGALRNNGVGNSALNLLATIDHDRFDVSVAFPAESAVESPEMVARIDSRANRLPRSGRMNELAFALPVRKKFEGGGGGALMQRWMDRLFSAEWRRCFGDAEFDYVMDLNGYSAFSARLMSQAPVGTKAIWLHSDMAADAQRQVNGRFPNRANVLAVIERYSHFDRLVSVSSALRDVNRRKLGGPVEPSKFVSARNTIDRSRLVLSDEPSPATIERDPMSARQLEVRGLRDCMMELAQTQGLDALKATMADVETAYRVVASGGDTPVRFVTVGRLSPEKAHWRLMNAFALLNQEFPDTQLVIVGDGPLADELKDLASSLGVSDSVVFTGQVQNPTYLLKVCDCFVLSSDYEGQPMVILEALALGLPVISTHFDSIRDALPDGFGVVVESDPTELAAAMRSFVEQGQTPPRTFDVQAYNDEALAELSAALGVTERRALVDRSPVG